MEAKIHIMTRKLMEYANLVIRQEPMLKFVSYTGHNRSFLLLSKDVKVAINGLKTRHPIFLFRIGDHNFVLG